MTPTPFPEIGGGLSGRRAGSRGALYDYPKSASMHSRKRC